MEDALDVEPYRVVRAVPAVNEWRWPVQLRAPVGGRIELLLDFGTELHATLELTITTNSLCNVLISFGESEVEADGLIPAVEPEPILVWRVLGAGTQTKLFDTIRAHLMGSRWHTPRGFRFVRLVVHDVRSELRIDRLGAHAQFTFTKRRAWQTSVLHSPVVYPAGHDLGRHQARPRRLFGDARIIAETNDAVWHEPRPVTKMLASLPTNEWCNGVPVYSFDAIAMLHQHILAFGTDAPAVAEAYARTTQFLE